MTLPNDLLSKLKPHKKAKSKKDKEDVLLGDTYWGTHWSSSRDGTLRLDQYNPKTMRASVRYTIETAIKRYDDGKSSPLIVLDEEEFQLSLQTLPHRGTAKIAFLDLDLLALSQALGIPLKTMKADLSNARSTAWLSELWCANCFGMVRILGDSPGVDGYFLVGDTMEFASVKSLAKHGFTPQFSSFTSHGTRNAFDSLAMDDCLHITKWIAVVDTTLLPQVQLTLIPSLAISDWAKDGLLIASGMGASRLLALVGASCDIEITNSTLFDTAALEAQNKASALEDAQSMAPSLAKRRSSIEDFAARIKSKS